MPRLHPSHYEMQIWVNPPALVLGGEAPQKQRPVGELRPLTAAEQLRLAVYATDASMVWNLLHKRSLQDALMDALTEQDYNEALRNAIEPSHQQYEQAKFVFNRNADIAPRDLEQRLHYSDQPCNDISFTLTTQFGERADVGFLENAWKYAAIRAGWKLFREPERQLDSLSGKSWTNPPKLAPHDSFRQFTKEYAAKNLRWPRPS